MRENNTRLFKCYFCSEEKRIRKSAFDPEGKNFCSRKCKDEWQKEGLKGENNPFHNREHNELTKAMIGATKFGVNLIEYQLEYAAIEVPCNHCGTPTLKDHKARRNGERFFCSLQCHGKWMSENLIGENNYRWNDELTDEERENGRTVNPGYYVFVKGVMARDNYTCRICGFTSQGGTGLNAHHLNSYDWDKENRTNIDNGITLCKDCHKDFHTHYGYGKNTKKQFEEYINNKEVAI